MSDYQKREYAFKILTPEEKKPNQTSKLMKVQKIFHLESHLFVFNYTVNASY